VVALKEIPLLKFRILYLCQFSEYVSYLPLPVLFLYKIYVRRPSWRLNTGYFLKEMISHNQLTLDLILFQSYQVSAFMKPSSGFSYPRTEWAVHNQGGRPSPLHV
jgi:hypothetical protein